MNKTAGHLKTIRQHYPDAQSTADAVERYLDLFQRRLGLRPSDILLADSICADDINCIEYPQRASQMPGPFKLGGLDGFPFAGLTGMGAFAGHVPDHGAVFIYHGPHIGITKEGVLGQILRIGQSAPSGCCGACRAALAKLQAGTIRPGEIDELDYQQHSLEQIVLTHAPRILNAPHPLKEATEVIGEAIASRIDLLVSRTKYKARYVILAGAVLINSDYDVGSFTAPRRLIVKDLQTGTTEDVLSVYQA
ncbi:MAG: hypothetical protein IT389_00010 [Nitrospira sp.]|nr:hypothetical protein [Nitrospira sp.]